MLITVRKQQRQPGSAADAAGAAAYCRLNGRFLRAFPPKAGAFWVFWAEKSCENGSIGRRIVLAASSVAAAVRSALLVPFPRLVLLNMPETLRKVRITGQKMRFEKRKRGTLSGFWAF